MSLVDNPITRAKLADIASAPKSEHPIKQGQIPLRVDDSEFVSTGKPIDIDTLLDNIDKSIAENESNPNQ